MTRAQLLAVAAAISALGAGTVVFITANADGSLDGTVTAPAMFNVLDRSQCSVAACNAPACNQAKNVLQDAGSSCTVGFADCSARIGPVARNIAADAGLVFSAALYQRVRFVGMRCPGADGGFTYAIPVDDGGWPLFALSVTTPLCVRAPLDGGTSCLRDLGDGDGGKFFGTGNVFPASQATGSNCDQVECSVLYGDDPAVTL